MKPSRIIKSAYRRACKAGYKGSLKAYARISLDNDACARWLNNKAKQRRPGANRRANKGHAIVHNMAGVRSMQHTHRGNIVLRGTVAEAR